MYGTSVYIYFIVRITILKIKGGTFFKDFLHTLYGIESLHVWGNGCMYIIYFHIHPHLIRTLKFNYKENKVLCYQIYIPNNFRMPFGLKRQLRSSTKSGEHNVDLTMVDRLIV